MIWKPLCSCLALGIFVVLGNVWLACAQEKNAAGLIPNPELNDPVTSAQLPPGVLFSDTAIAVRYFLMNVIAFWNVEVVCDVDLIALNFWGEAERLAADVCSSNDTFGELYGYSYIRAIEREFPESARQYGEVMEKNGYDSEDRSTDKATAVGMGNAIGMRVAEWFGKDGWNSLGNKRREHFGRPFEDYTGYTPVNNPWKLNYPLRWQPLETSDSRVGRYTYQQHVVPFLGQVRPFLLTQEEAAAKQVDLPYMDMNATELVGNDAAVMKKLMGEVFDASKNLSPMQRFLAHWWDNKFLSVGVFSVVYGEILRTSERFNARWFLGEMLAQHDAMVIAWKEKRRVDAVRPQTIARNFYGDQRYDVFVDKEKGVQSVQGKDWEPLVVTQPHSEFPSASACLCTAFADHAALMLREQMDAQSLSKEPIFKFQVNPATLPFDADGVEFVEFNSVKEAGRSCGVSRLWAGVHFSPSIPAGEKLAGGIGEKAYLLMKDLAEGRVPDNCWWCTEQ